MISILSALADSSLIALFLLTTSRPETTGYYKIQYRIAIIRRTNVQAVLEHLYGI